MKRNKKLSFNDHVELARKQVDEKYSDPDEERPLFLAQRVPAYVLENYQDFHPGIPDLSEDKLNILKVRLRASDAETGVFFTEKDGEISEWCRPKRLDNYDFKLLKTGPEALEDLRQDVNAVVPGWLRDQYGDAYFNTLAEQQSDQDHPYKKDRKDRAQNPRHGGLHK